MEKQRRVAWPKCRQTHGDDARERTCGNAACESPHASTPSSRRRKANRRPRRPLFRGSICMVPSPVDCGDRRSREKKGATLAQVLQCLIGGDSMAVAGTYCCRNVSARLQQRRNVCFLRNEFCSLQNAIDEIAVMIENDAFGRILRFSGSLATNMGSKVLNSKWRIQCGGPKSHKRQLIYSKLHIKRFLI